MRRFLLALLYWANSLLRFSQVLHVTKAQICVKSLEVEQHLCVAELEEANGQLRVELAATHTKVAEVEHREWCLTSDYDGLHRDFGDLQTYNATIVKEKADLEKTEHEKAQWFCILLRKILAGLRRDMEESIAALGGGGGCMDFPTTDATVFDMLEWFRTEVRVLPTTFTECKENITCFALIGAFRMLAGWSVSICQSLRNQLYPVMLHFCMMCLTTLVR
jgi:hypothetical protein